MFVLKERKIVNINQEDFIFKIDEIKSQVSYKESKPNAFGGETKTMVTENITFIKFKISVNLTTKEIANSFFISNKNTDYIALNILSKHKELKKLNNEYLSMFTQLYQ